MNALLYQVARLSLTAGWMTLLLILLRPLLRKVPRRFSCLLWALVGVRLMLPFSLESRVSLVPQPIAAPAVLFENNPAALPAAAAQAPSAAPAFSWLDVLPWVWAAGVAIMALYALVSSIRLHRRVQVSLREAGNVYLCDNIRSPFVLGIVRPKIYLPSAMDPQLRDCVLSHERAHLRRGDHLWKPLGYCLLAVYWFNPLCWLAYVLFCRDMEQACDEAVIHNLDGAGKKHYSAALLACSIPRSSIAACPLAFGEVGIKQRIRGVLRYRKPKFWMVLAAAVLCVSLAVGLLTDPVQAETVSHSSPAAQDVPAETLPSTCALYVSPSETSRVLATLEAGTAVTVLRAETIGQRSWAYVQCSDERTGWILRDSESTDASLPQWSEADALAGKTGHFTVLNPVLYVIPEETALCRSPSETSTALLTLEAETQVLVLQLETIGTTPWAYVQYGDTTGWIKGGSDMLPTGSDAPSQALDLPGTGVHILFQEAPLYYAPSETSRVLITLEAHTSVTVKRVEKVGGIQWAYVQYGDTMGWLQFDGEDETTVPDTEDPVFHQGPTVSYILPQDATLYAAPSEATQSLATLDARTSVSIWNLDSIGGIQWAYIQYGDTYGWIRYDGDIPGASALP